MAHFLTQGEEYQDWAHSDDYRAYLITRSHPAAGDRFGRSRTKRVRVHVRRVFRRLAGYWRRMIEAIAHAKLRRMNRELELRGIRFDCSRKNWTVGVGRVRLPSGRLKGSPRNGTGC